MQADCESKLFFLPKTRSVAIAISKTNLLRLPRWGEETSEITPMSRWVQL